MFWAQRLVISGTKLEMEQHILYQEQKRPFLKTDIQNFQKAFLSSITKELKNPCISFKNFMKSKWKKVCI